MSFTLGDSLRDQILRGEVYYAAWTGAAVVDPGEDYDVVVSNPTNDTEFSLQSNISGDPTTFVFKRGAVVNVAGASVAVRNRKYGATGGNTITIQETPVSYISEGTEYNTIHNNTGELPILFPASIEAPLILEAGLNYLFRFSNNGPHPVVYSFGAYMRELV